MVNDWKTVKFENVCAIVAPMVNPQDLQYWMLPHIGNENIEKHTGKLLKYHLVKDDNLISGKYYFTEDEVLYGKINPHFAKVAYPGFSGLCSADMYPIRCTKEVVPGFLKYVLLTEKFTSYTTSVSMRSGMPKINRNELAEYQFSLPSLLEQKRIAEALSDVDSMISSLEKLIAKKKAVKNGAMQELLTGKKRLQGFTGKWERILLEDVCIFYNGGTPSKKRSDWWNGNIPWISSSDLSENSITSVNINRYITQDALDHSATRLCPKNAVSIISRVGVGKVAVTPCELCTSQDFATIVSSAHNPYFLAYMLVPIMKDMAMQAQGTSIKGVTVEDIAKIKISTPSIEEQNQIVSVLSDMDNAIEELEQKLAKTRQIKQGMMQQLLTGKIRLV